MESSLQRMESSSSSSSVPKFPQPKRGLIKANIFGNLVKTTTSMSSHREQLDKSLLSEENIPLVTLDAAPNDAEEKHVPYAATRDSEAPADNLAKPNSEENIQLVTLNAAPNDAKEEQVTYAAARDSEAPADNLAKLEKVVVGWIWTREDVACKAYGTGDMFQSGCAYGGVALVAFSRICRRPACK